jgi:hypothetical protein
MRIAKSNNADIFLFFPSNVCSTHQQWLNARQLLAVGDGGELHMLRHCGDGSLVLEGSTPAHDDVATSLAVAVDGTGCATGSLDMTCELRAR